VGLAVTGGVGPRGARAVRKLADFAGRRWVLNPPGCGYRLALQRACDRAGIGLDIAAEVTGRALQISLISRGLGLGLVPRRQVTASPQRRALKILTPEDFRLEATIALLHGPALGLLAPAVDHLRDGVAARLAL
jgi:DNA-binding transcriptional LysR family regulator